MIKLTHIITDLLTGGAEIMLYRLLSRMNRSDFRMEVISLTTDGPIGARIRELDIPVHALHMSRSVPNPLALWKLARLLSRSKPDVVQTWMYHANLAGALAMLPRGDSLIWGLHNSALSPLANRARTRLTSSACAALSHRIPGRIVCCSHATLEAHRNLGYAVQKMIMIPNGFDTNHFRPCKEARAYVRRELDIPLDAPLVGVIARFDPQKDHRNFIEAIALLSPQFPSLHVLCCGAFVTWQNAELARWISRAGLESRCHLLGLQNDTARIAAALDVACSPSACEAFPLAVGEAMACAVPCVVTDVGDSAYMVGETGRVVPPANPSALADGLRDLLLLSSAARNQLGMAARARIERHFSLPQVVDRYQAVYSEAALSN